MTMLMTRRVFTAVGAVGLITLAAACGSSSASSTSASAPATSAPAASTSAPAVAASSASASPSATPAVVLKTQQTALGTVLTNAGGFTVYWFAKDSSTASACAGACAAAWPPVLGMPQAASGVKLGGKLGEIKRPDGIMQATFDGHPLYLFVGDRSPGQANGNGVAGFGALWYAIKIGISITANTGASANTGTSSSSGYGGSSGSGGSSGYGGSSGSGGMGGSGGGGSW